MNISSVQYYKDKEINSDGDWVSVGDNIGVIITIDSKEYHAPLDANNRYYAAVLEWVADGNTIQDAD